MHTAQTLDVSMFAIAINGRAATRDALLEWQLNDRMGVIVTTPLGGLGASLMMQLAITAYYDVKPSRRTERPTYPELHLFHWGGRYGDFSNFDLRPNRKEIFVDTESDLLTILNAHGITHLLVPDIVQRAVLHAYQEPEAAIDRIRHCFVYSPDGRPAGANVSINAVGNGCLENIKNTLDPYPLIQELPRLLNECAMETRADTEQWARRFQARAREVDEPDRRLMQRYRDALSTEGSTRETYRRISIEDALGMLHYEK